MRGWSSLRKVKQSPKKKNIRFGTVEEALEEEEDGQVVQEEQATPEAEAGATTDQRGHMEVVPLRLLVSSVKGKDMCRESVQL